MQLAVVLGLAAAGGVMARIFRQPVLLGYIAAGVLISIVGFGDVKHLIELMGQLGVTLLLFLLGLEMSFGELKRMGRVALATGLGQIIFTSLVGYAIGLGLGFSPVGSLYLSVALAFSSTIIIVKLLSEKRDLQSLYGKIAVGFLLVQDFVAIGILIVLSGFSLGQIGWGQMGWVLVKGVVMVGVTIWLSGKVLPKILDWLGTSTEMLFVAVVAWCLAVAAVVASPLVGFSIEIGGFLAGLALSNAVEHLQIISRVRPLRDFFLTLFFVALGANISVGDLSGIIVPAIVMSLFVLVGNPLIVMVIMGLMGYKKRTSFMASVTVGQISEFSLIVMALAFKIGHVGSDLLTLTAIVGAVTMTVSTYMILYADWLYRRLEKWLGVFERKVTVEKGAGVKSLGDRIILFGYNRVGSVLRPALEKLGKKLVVVDFNPAVVEKLASEKEVNVVYGDMGDYELYEELEVGQASLVVSTVVDVGDNLQLLEAVGKRGPMVIVTAADINDAKELYAAGADYVLVPSAVGGEYLAHMLKGHGADRQYWRNLR